MPKWEDIAIEKLLTYNAKKVALSGLHLELESLKAEAFSIRSQSARDIPCKSASAPNDRLLSNIAMQQEIVSNIRSVKLDVERIETAFSCLNAEEQVLLDRFYVNRRMGHVEKLCEDLNLEQSAVYKRKSKALRNFTIAMYGKTQS